MEIIGLDEEKIKEISKMKNESEDVLEYRLKCYDMFKKIDLPKFGPKIDIDFDKIKYYKNDSDLTIKDDWININKNIKDKAEFYYSLYYELSKVKSYFNKLKKSIILSLKNEKIEKQEQFALNEMVSNEIYKNIKENIYNIDAICKKNKVAVDFAHFRLIKDKLIKADKQYQKIIE